MCRQTALLLATVLLLLPSAYGQTPTALGTSSARGYVGTTDDQLVSGWILSGSGSGDVLVRALGPSLPNVSGQLGDPVLTLFDMNGEVIAANDNWKDSQRAAIEATGRQPSNDLESAILARVPDGSYSAIVSGKNNTTGIGKIEMIDLDVSSAPNVREISTRARVAAASAALLDEFVIGGSVPRKVLIRGLGPSLSSSGFVNPLADPTLTLRDSSGRVLVFNNNWRDRQEEEVLATSFAPTNNSESAIVASLSPGTYTAAMEGVCGASGVALLRVNDLGPASTTSLPGSSHYLSCGPASPSVVVTTTADYGPGSLRAAIGAVPPGGTIGFSKTTAGGAVNFYDGTAHTIALASEVVLINKSLTIAGPNPNLLTVSGNRATRVFDVWPGTTVTIDNVKVADGAVTNGPGNLGGGIYNQGNLTLSTCIVSNNSVTAAQFDDRAGGGIYNRGTLTILNSVVSDNVASGGLVQKGGGIANDIGTLTITNSTIANNAAAAGAGQSGFGGGIYNTGIVNLNGVTLAANSAGGQGGAGGGIRNEDDAAKSSTVNIRNTIVAGNIASAHPDVSGRINSKGYNLIGNSTGATITGTSEGNVLDRNANLGSLADNGGPTKTMRVLPASPAIDAGADFTALASASDASTTSITVVDATAFPPGVGFVLRIDAEQMIVTAKTGNVLSVTRAADGTAAAAHAAGAGVNPAFDQRGQPRKAGNAIDIGAFETNYGLSVTSGGTQATTVGSGFGSVFQLQLTENGQPLSGVAVTFTAPSSGASGTFANGSTSVTVLTDANGFATSPAFTANSKAGSYAVVVAFSGSTSSISYQLTNNPGPTARFIVSAPATVDADAAFNLSVSAVDQFDNVVTGYSGTVRFTSSDPNAALPADATLTNGTGTFTAVLESGGKQTITAIDQAAASIKGSSAAIYVRQTHPLNISTRLNVLTGENVLIGGFFITGNAPKKVIVRAIGPSLTADGEPLPGRLQDPRLELFNAAGDRIAANDDWKIDSATGESQQAEVEATTVPPVNDSESALVRTLNPGAYTAILSGKEAATGIALVEVYDLDTAADSQFANISTRGFVDTGNNVMIGGFILGGGTNSGSVLVRGIGPSLADAGVGNALPNPRLELYNASGEIVATNDDWKTSDASGQSQQAAIEATTIPPRNDVESAILVTLQPGAYTAVLAGKDGTSGVGLVELYNLR